MSTIQKDVVVSVIIVNYKVPDYLIQALRSLREAKLYDSLEVIIVDNASHDNSQELVSHHFPEVHWIALKNNIGFGKACNVGAQNAQGKYLLFLNPDTLVSKNTLEVFVDFLDRNPDIGIVGPKIIDQDGTFQPYCRRSFPKPLFSFIYLFGISKLVPKKNKLFGRYHLTFLSPDESLEVDAISGSCMFMRYSLYKEIDGFDKAFFMFGEDLDLCARCRQAGYKVWYNPDTQIIHFKGRSNLKNLIQSRIAFYEAMIIFSKKYQKTYGAFFPGWVLTIGVLVKAVVNIGMILLKSSTACFIDLFFINGIVWSVTAIRFNLVDASNPYIGSNIITMLGMHGVISLCFLLTYAIQGVYSAERYSSKNTLLSSLIASILFLSTIFFVKSMAFSRVAFAISTVLISLVLVGWRTLLPLITNRLKQSIYSTGEVVIVGEGPIASVIVKNIEQDKSARIIGIVWNNSTSASMPGQWIGYPVLGTLDQLNDILKIQHADLLIIASLDPWYSVVIEMLTFSRLTHLSIKWVEPELFKLTEDTIPDQIPLNDFSF